MVKLLDTPEDIAVLGPVVEREIYYRILRGELGLAWSTWRRARAAIIASSGH